MYMMMPVMRATRLTVTVVEMAVVSSAFIYVEPSWFVLNYFGYVDLVVAGLGKNLFSLFYIFFINFEFLYSGVFHTWCLSWDPSLREKGE